MNTFTTPTEEELERELELLSIIRNGSRVERDDAFSDLVLLGHIASVISAMSHKPRRGMDAMEVEARLYEWLFLTALELDDGEPVSSRWALASYYLADECGAGTLASVAPRQMRRYEQVERAVEDGRDLREVLRQVEMGEREWNSIRAITASSASIDLDTIVSSAPSIQAYEQEETRVIMALCDELLDDEEKNIFHFRHFHDELEDLSDERVAEEINRDAGEQVTYQRAVHRKRTAALGRIREALGLRGESAA